MNYQCSAVTPTRNRSRYIATAVEHFNRQTVRYKQWVILDDAEDPIGPLIPKQENIRYEQVGRLSLAALHNLGAELASGEVICHFDDDDFQSPFRMQQQIQDAKKTGLSGGGSILMWDEDTHQCWKYVPQQPWFLTGGALCYTREFIRANPFPDETWEDYSLCNLHKHVAIAGPDESVIVMRIHLQNSNARDLTAGCFRPITPADMPDWFQREGVELLPGKRQ